MANDRMSAQNEINTDEETVAKLHELMGGKLGPEFWGEERKPRVTIAGSAVLWARQKNPLFRPNDVDVWCNASRFPLVVNFLQKHLGPNAVVVRKTKDAVQVGMFNVINVHWRNPCNISMFFDLDVCSGLFVRDEIDYMDRVDECIRKGVQVLGESPVVPSSDVTRARVHKYTVRGFDAPRLVSPENGTFSGWKKLAAYNAWIRDEGGARSLTTHSNKVRVPDVPSSYRFDCGYCGECGECQDPERNVWTTDPDRPSEDAIMTELYTDFSKSQ